MKAQNNNESPGAMNGGIYGDFKNQANIIKATTTHSSPQQQDCLSDPAVFSMMNVNNKIKPQNEAY